MLSIGKQCLFDVTELTLSGGALALRDCTHPAVCELRERNALLCAYANDLYSCAMEIACGDPINLVYVLVVEQEIEYVNAVDEAKKMYERELAQMHKLAARLRGDPDLSDHVLE